MRCTVIVPTYNRVDSLRRSLDALKAQTVPCDEFEVIVVSDGSTDGTDALLAERANSGKGAHIRAFVQKNLGPAAARNLGIEKAVSDLIVFVDDDVEPVPCFLERHLSHHEHNGEDKLVVIGPLTPNPLFTSNEPAWIAWEHAKLQATYDLFQTGFYSGHNPRSVHFYSGNASLRSKWIKQVGGFNVAFKRQEDVELAARLERQCGLTFQWDFSAEGLHHPVRSLASWLQIPTTYGALDADRVKAGLLERSEVDENLDKRHRGTRALIDLCDATPSLLEPVTTTFCRTATAAFRLGARNAALSTLSAVYNTRYMIAYNQRMSTGALATKPAASSTQ